jgi:transcription elongation factor Elf1
MKVIKLKDFRCTFCGGKKMIGSQYYAMQKNWVDITCINCSDSVDIEVRKLNKILRAFSFKTIEERYEFADENDFK